jgi:hypothetical protein
VLKIIKHCRDSFPENVAGSLLGYEKDDGQGNLVGVLEVRENHGLRRGAPRQEARGQPLAPVPRAGQGSTAGSAGWRRTRPLGPARCRPEETGESPHFPTTAR